MMNTKRFKILQDFSSLHKQFKINFRNQNNEDCSDKDRKVNTIANRSFRTRKNEHQRKRERTALEIWEEIEELTSES